MNTTLERVSGVQILCASVVNDAEEGESDHLAKVGEAWVSKLWMRYERATWGRGAR